MVGWGLKGLLSLKQKRAIKGNFKFEGTKNSVTRSLMPEIIAKYATIECNRFSKIWVQIFLKVT